MFVSFAPWKYENKQNNKYNIHAGQNCNVEKGGNSQYFMVAMLTGATHVTTLSMTIQTE